MQHQRVMGFSAAVLATAFLLLTGPGWANPEGDSKDKAAVVNGTVITMEEMERGVTFAREQAMSRGQRLDEKQVNEVRKDTLEKLIDSELLYQESKRAGFSADPKELEETFAGWRQRFPSEEEYKRTLDKLHITEQEMRTVMEKGLATKQYVTVTFLEKAEVSDEEMKKYYDEHPDFFQKPEEIRASHILIMIKPDAPEEEKEKARKKLEDIQEKLKQGEPFDQLAKEHSECPSSEQGGDLGPFSRGRMVKPFEDAAFDMEVDEVSEVVQTNFGLHLIKVTEKKEAGSVPFEEVKDRIAEFLKHKKAEEAVQEKLEELKKTAQIDTFLKN